ncbi:hypothetical protein EPUS_07783 [Endocarpon pusillum Z07020]|uniref:Bacteriophage T5 Orf172 DNA-binding domain-containing protein n=1 Tax=Endocarpon pusillum (strain Z07020 / HMAS-L-300199) TaxID=1263415 RepID=U1GH47_ENDPU|nr:uncharacterized protein EPUS_07783 [Endocarpon pusillum Z07020]ERF71111.1 hypothetical protein EPUS_07783 [Endocarpon pusillum Z07020]
MRARRKGLLRTIRAPLMSRGKPMRSAQKGYVYIVSRDADENCFKIGFSKHHPMKRVSRHRRCHDGAKLIAFTSAIQHAPRVEQLVHWDLSTNRRWEKCSRCKCEHREWFDVSKDMAIEAVSRWAGWICSQPYERQGGGLKAFWSSHLRSGFDPDSLSGHYWGWHTESDWAETLVEAKAYRMSLEHVESVKIHRYDETGGEIENAVVTDSILALFN